MPRSLSPAISTDGRDVRHPLPWVVVKLPVADLSATRCAVLGLFSIAMDAFFSLPVTPLAALNVNGV